MVKTDYSQVERGTQVRAKKNEGMALSRLQRRLLIASGLAAAAVAIALGAVYALLTLAVMPVRDGAELAGGAVTVVLTDRIGPIPIAAYVFELAEGGVGLVDTGADPEATAIRAALVSKGKSDADVRAIFFTHFHDDHRAGARAFPAADVYVPEALVERVAAVRRSAGMTGATHGFTDGDRVDVLGTPVEVFALPGHTPDSNAVLVHGVLFLGDSAGGLRDGTLGPNTLLSDDPEQTVLTLAALAERLAPRRDEIRAIAFGHQGPLDGLAPLLTWAATKTDQGR